MIRKVFAQSEELYLLGCNTVSSVESEPTFQRNMSPLSAGSKNKRSKKLAFGNAVAKHYATTRKVAGSNPG
jgi:hypothetical protein